MRLKKYSIPWSRTKENYYTLSGKKAYGELAQLGERVAGSEEVRVSIPLGSTNT